MLGASEIEPASGLEVWVLRLLPTLIIAGLLTSIPCPGYAGGPAGGVGMRHADGFRRPGTVSMTPFLGMGSPVRLPFGVFGIRSLLWGPGVVWVAPPQVVVIPVVVQQASGEAPTPVPEPKFVFPPTQSVPSMSNPHTVIVQRGSQIEVQSFPVAR